MSQPTSTTTRPTLTPDISAADMSTQMPASNRMRSPAAEAAQHNENETMGITLPSFTPTQESLFLTLGGRALEFYWSSGRDGCPFALNSALSTLRRSRPDSATSARQPVK